MCVFVFVRGVCECVLFFFLSSLDGVELSLPDSENEREEGGTRRGEKGGTKKR